jgi:N4-(beta-N-acetylglucosaminyl)-L-asparaginase
MARPFEWEGAMLTRREWLIGSMGTLAAGCVRAGARQDRPAAGSLPVLATTWEFGKKANGAAWAVLEKGGSALDAVEAGINEIELDPAEESVGYGGTPNEVGETTLDAMIMWGPTHDVGSVGCLKRVKKAISVARKVMERTKHTLLVGEDATLFAVKMGFELESLTNERSSKMWEDWVKKGRKPNHWEAEPRQPGPEKKDHDTIGMVAIDKAGDVCVGLSTNGLDFKIPGRVGDSPITGAGGYCDNDVGGAVATGNGDVMMRFLATYQTVESMRRGAAPSDAARDALERIAKKGFKIGGAVVAVNKKGEYGAAALNYALFPYAVRNASTDEIVKIKGF